MIWNNFEIAGKILFEQKSEHIGARKVVFNDGVDLRWERDQSGYQFYNLEIAAHQVTLWMMFWSKYLLLIPTFLDIAKSFKRFLLSFVVQTDYDVQRLYSLSGCLKTLFNFIWQTLKSNFLGESLLQIPRNDPLFL